MCSRVVTTNALGPQEIKICMGVLSFPICNFEFTDEMESLFSKDKNDEAEEAGSISVHQATEQSLYRCQNPLFDCPVYTWRGKTMSGAGSKQGPLLSPFWGHSLMPTWINIAECLCFSVIFFLLEHKFSFWNNFRFTEQLKI